MEINKKKKMGKCCRGLLWAFILLGVVAFPFIIDYAYGAGYLSNYPNNFPASDWFSFIGSYFPAVFFGITALVQAHIIDKKTTELEEIQNRYRYTITGKGKIYGYEKEPKKLGEYDSHLLMKIICAGNIEMDEDEDFSKFIYIEFMISDKEEIAVNQIEIHDIKWKIATNTIEMSHLQIFTPIMERCEKGYLVKTFCKVIDEGNFDEIFRHVTNGARDSREYQSSYLNMELYLTDFEDQKWLFQIEFDFQCTEKPFCVESINERIKGKRI